MTQHSRQHSAQQGRKKHNKQHSKRSRGIGNALLVIFVLCTLVGAGVLIWQATLPPESIEAPIPEQDFEDIPLGEPVGPIETVLDDGTTMSPEAMAPGTVFIPSLRTYMPVGHSQEFGKSRYVGFDSLKVPMDPQRSVWYSQGAPLYGDDLGTTMIASHVSANGRWGGLRYLYTLGGGEMIYTKDDAGQLQSWQVSGMRTEPHREFPQEYWSAEGERRLVLTTCGGPIIRGAYRDNIFAIAHPVDPVPRTAEQLSFEKMLDELPEHVDAWAAGLDSVPAPAPTLAPAPALELDNRDGLDSDSRISAPFITP